MPRRIAVITGTRAEYGLLVSPMQAIAADSRLELQLVVTGMHLLPAFGRTINQIRADGWRIAARVPMQRGDDRPGDQAEGLARGVAGLARYFERARSEIVVVLGDRIEAMAGALAAVTTGRVLAHIHGGDVAPGDFDDSLRHAITKLAHVHFAATRGAARRIRRLGEDPHRIHVVGAVGLDRLRAILAQRACRRCFPQRPPAAAERIGCAVCPRHGPLPPNPVTVPRPYALVVYHAWGRSAATEARTMDTLLNVVAAAGLARVILYPNTDRGHRGVIAALERHARRSPRGTVQVVRSLPRDEYLQALCEATVLVGNSSSGVIEAPLAGTPSVSVGPRQAGREPGGPTVIECDEAAEALRAALARALRLPRRPGRRSVYGDGRAGERIARVLAELPLTAEFTRKVITC